MEKLADKKTVKEPRNKMRIRILPDVEYIKLAEECRICTRSKYNKGPCGGREGVNICLAFTENPSAAKREKVLSQC